MKRRNFNLLAGASIAVSTGFHTARAQQAPADPSLLTTTLTPMGGERAGNADGTIPAWNGGMVSGPLPLTTNVAVPLFQNEQPLYEVNAGNMGQYESFLSEGVKYQISKFGLSLKLYQTHRTAAAPQYVYDNAAKNVTRAQFDPRGGRFGFTGAVSAPPFPIINTAEPLIGGAQLIWNHLTVWQGVSNHALFTPGTVIDHGEVILVNGTISRLIFPYYAPGVTPESYDGYYSKGHFYSKAPEKVVGQESLVWHSTNVNVNPDIVWTLLNGQGRVRKAPDEAYDAPSPASNGIANIDESSCFYGNPSEYNWTYITKKELLVPYNCNALVFTDAQKVLGPHFPDPNVIRWEKHRVWVVEATLAPGSHNVMAKRRFYIDEDTWLALLGEGYDAQGKLVKAYTNYNICIPSLPGTIQQATSTFDLLTGDYTFNGKNNFGSFQSALLFGPQLDSYFEPQEMAATASF
jgi:hypothetical protein